MKSEPIQFTKKQFRFSAAIPYVAFVALSLYLIFPILNLVRRKFGNGGILFQPWRDYIFCAAFVFLACLILLIWDFRNENLFSRLKNGFLQNPAWILLALLSVWTCVSAAVTGFDFETVIGSEKSRTGLICTLVYFLFFVMALCVRKKKLIRIWTALLMAVGLEINLLIVLDYFILGSKANLASGSMIFYNSNHLSYYLLVETVCAYMVFLLSGKNWIRILSFLSFLLGTSSLLIADTLGCVIALVMSFLFSGIVLFLTGKFKWKGFLAVVLAAGIVFLVTTFVPNAENQTLKDKVNHNMDDLTSGIEAVTDIENAPGSAGSGRAQLWKCAVEATLENPIFGVGLSDMRLRLSNASDGGNNTVHNEFLEYSSNHGIPELILYLAFLLAVFIRGAKNRKALTDMNVLSLCAAFAYLVSSFVGVSMFYTAPYLFIFLGFGYYRKEEASDAVPDNH